MRYSPPSPASPPSPWPCPPSALTVEAKVSTEFQKKLDDDIGAREAAGPDRRAHPKINNAFAQQGVKADRVVVTIEDAKPNRPTMEQVSEQARPRPDALDQPRRRPASPASPTTPPARKSARSTMTGTRPTSPTSSPPPPGPTPAPAFDRFARRFADKLIVSSQRSPTTNAAPQGAAFLFARLRNPRHLVRLQAQPPLRMREAIGDARRRVRLALRPIHRLQEEIPKASHANFSGGASACG